PQLHLVAHRADDELHSEVRALERAGSVAAAEVALALAARIGTAVPALDGERERLGHAEQRQLALDHAGVLAVEFRRLTLVAHRRKFGDVEEVGRSQVPVARARVLTPVGVAGAQRRGWNRELDRAGLRGGVERYLARHFLEVAADDR